MAEVGLFDRAGSSLRIDEVAGVRALLSSSEPIDEPVVGRGPIVMNTQRESLEAIADYQSGEMGHLL